jgi:hypothetical protein
MESNTYNIGISAENALKILSENPTLMIVGYQGSGKSTLAESFDMDFTKKGYNVKLSCAKTWLLDNKEYSIPNETRSRIDPEIIAIISYFEQSSKKGIWIVDDAEILLAYASQNMLINLSEKVRSNNINIIAIRNYFINEDSGWFYKKQSLLSQKIIFKYMQPLDIESTLVECKLLFRSKTNLIPSTWLSKMSGGVPGLIGELYQYTPEWEEDNVSAKLKKFIKKKQFELDVEKPTRRLLATALAKKILPPKTFLSQNIRAELGALIIKGAVSPSYMENEFPFNGKIWEIVLGVKVDPLCLPDIFINVGLNFEILLRETDFLIPFSNKINLNPNIEGLVAQSVASSLYCEKYFPELVCSINSFLIDFFGKRGLIYLLSGIGIKADVDETNMELIDSLFNKLT